MPALERFPRMKPMEAQVSIASCCQPVVHAADYEESHRLPDLEARCSHDDQSDMAQQ